MILHPCACACVQLFKLFIVQSGYSPLGFPSQALPMAPSTLLLSLLSLVEAVPPHSGIITLSKGNET